MASFISDGLPPETVVGMITFNENADVQRPPVTLRTPEDRQKFVDHLPTDCGGATSIASALVRAAEARHKHIFLSYLRVAVCVIILIVM